MIKIVTTLKTTAILKRSLEAVGFCGQIWEYTDAEGSHIGQMLRMGLARNPHVRVALWCDRMIAVRPLIALEAAIIRMGIFAPSVPGVHGEHVLYPHLVGATRECLPLIRAWEAGGDINEILRTAGTERPDPSAWVIPHQDGPIPPGVTFLRRAA